MNLTILFRIIGLILLILAIAMAVCFLLAGYNALAGDPEPHHGVFAIGVSCLLTAGGGGLCLFVGRKSKIEDLLRKEAVAIVGLGWIIAALFGCLPFWLHSDLPVSFTEAFFESMSGFTTTGSTIIKDLTPYPDSLLLWRSLTQWIGGLGILALFVALLSMLGISGKSLLGQESSLNLGAAPTARVKDLTARLWAVYFSLTLLSVLGLYTTGKLLALPDMSLLNALFYSLTAVSTGGFAPHNDSVAHFGNVIIEMVLAGFMIVSSLNMIMVINITSGNFNSPVGKTEAKTFLIILAVAAIIVVANLWWTGQTTAGAALRQAFFPIVTLSSSTGFGTVDYDQWPLCSRCVLLFLMIVGGSSGSTAGGIKVSRFLLAIRQVSHEIQRSFRPNRVFSITLDKRKVERGAQVQIMSYLVFVAGILLLSTIVISALEPGIEDLESALGAVAATFFNMGPGFGSVGPTDNFAGMHGVTLMFLSLLMLLGRLEVFVVVALFDKALWTRY